MSGLLQPTHATLPPALDQPNSHSHPQTTPSAPPPPPPPHVDPPASPDNAHDDSESDGGNVSDGGTKEPFANLNLDERRFEDDKRRTNRKAQLVMGPPLGQAQAQDGSAQGALAQQGDQVIEGQALAENQDILADLDDDALDLELTHLRLRTLRGLGIERFRKVQVSRSHSVPCCRRVLGC